MSGVIPNRFAKIREKYTKVIEEMDVEEFKSYLFPNLPIPPSMLEEDFTKRIFGILDKNDELSHIFQVSAQLDHLITMECRFKYKAECDIKIGKRLRVNPLLFPSGKGYLVRRNGLKVGPRSVNLSAKYVMLCCFVVPLHWNSVARKVAVACYELYSKMRNQFEMVIVAIMRDGWTHDKKAFRHFMSGFPSRCLAIPFSAKSHRHRVCKSLGGMSIANITLVSPSGNVLMHSEAHCCDDLHFVPRCHLVSSRPFPFIADPGARMCHRTPSCFEDFLCCKTSDFVFRKTSSGSEAFSKEKVAVSTLKSKLVGLYLYSSGHLFPLLREIEEACRQNDKELEIVVAYIHSWHMQDPRRYPEFFSTALAKQNISWWVAPYNNSASMVLENSLEGEKVIILGPNDSYIDTYGAELMQIYGITAYPFTVKHTVQKTLEELSKVTLESFLEMFKLRFEHHHTGKNVLFYFDYSSQIKPIVYDAYTRFTCDTNVVILACSLSNAIIVTEPKVGGSIEVRVKPSWLKNYRAVDKFFKRFFNHVFPTIVAFGKDGRICSVLAHRLPSSQGVKSWPVKCDLFEEVSSILVEYLESNDDYESRYLREPPDVDHGWEELQELRQSWMMS